MHGRSHWYVVQIAGIAVTRRLGVWLWYTIAVVLSHVEWTASRPSQTILPPGPIFKSALLPALAFGQDYRRWWPRRPPAERHGEVRSAMIFSRHDTSATIAGARERTGGKRDKVFALRFRGLNHRKKVAPGQSHPSGKKVT
jgi:hypothetical protein